MMRSRSPKDAFSFPDGVDDEEAAPETNHLLRHLDGSEVAGRVDSPRNRLLLEVEPSSSRQPPPRGRRYLARVSTCRASPTILAFLSHGFFLVGSLAYVLLALGDLSWYRTTIEIPREVYTADDDAAWEQLGNEELWDAKDDYEWTYHIYYLVGAVSFVFVGALDWMRYGDCMDAFMILAGLAGVVSVLSPTARQEVIWDAVSIHLYLLEACNLFRREHHLTGRGRLFRVGDVCFLAGNIIDVTVVYLSLAGRSGLGIIRADLAAQILWLVCALIDTAREIFTSY
mmetsp:Transcript_19446/g.45562  ORF Transcript_19446/g.45562 Transcript_19446/m.45562 type:complete len:285 (+) Transcript_19446:315-1169(+)